MAGFFNDTFALNILTVCLKSSNLSLFCVGFFVLLFVCFFGGGFGSDIQLNSGVGNWGFVLNKCLSPPLSFNLMTFPKSANLKFVVL